MNMGKTMILNKFREAKYNPRRITEKELNLLGESYQKYGDLSGVVIDEKTKNVISGNQRFKILKDKKTKIVTEPLIDQYGTVRSGYIQCESKNGPMRIPLRIVDWDITKQKEANIAANALGGEFDNEKLALLLAELDADKFDLESIGITPYYRKQLNVMNKRVSNDFKPIDFDAPEFDTEQTCPKCKFKF
jgi:hypothetical protein